jgi:hypothetical protein
MILLINLKYRPETPPNTPQRARSAARQNERDNRNLDSPEHRRTPHHSGPAQIPPLQLPIPPAPPVPGNAIVPDDPFGPPLAPIQFNGRQYQHLPAHLAQQLAALPALPSPRGRGRGRGRGIHPAPPMPVSCENYIDG